MIFSLSYSYFLYLKIETMKNLPHCKIVDLCKLLQ